MSEQTEQTEKTADSTLPAPLLPQLIGRLGLYATYVAAALISLAIAGDLDVLMRRAPLVGWLALLVGTGPLLALLLSTLASYANYYGVWRILRGKDEYDAGQDLKSHAADVPQAAQAMLADRAGCLPVASTALLFVSLLLAVATTLPPETPLIGELGTWSGHLGDLAAHAGPAMPPVALAPTATLTAVPTAIPTPTATPRPTAPPTATPIPVVIKFSVSPTTASWTSCTNGSPPPSKMLTLDNSGSNVAIRWSVSAVEKIPPATGNPWATITPASGAVPAHGKQIVTIKPVNVICRSSSPPGKPWHVKIVANGAGTFTFTYTIS